MKEKVKDILIRAIKTFIQGFVASLPVLTSTNITDQVFMKSVIIGALAGGVSALMNSIITFLDSAKEV